jgi:ribosomal protein L29
MKSKSNQSLTEMNVDQLKKLATEQRQELSHARLLSQAGKSKGGSVPRLADQLARTLTHIRQKELSI